jgi:hypothetical protein
MRQLFLASCVFAVGCAGEGTRAPTAPTMGAAAQTQAQVAPTESQSAAPALQAHDGTEVPFRGTLQAVEIHTGAPPVLHSVLTGTGQATHFGRFATTFEFDIQIGVMMPSTTTGSFTLTAANGDSISGTLAGVGTVASGVVTIVETATITEGTGRFADATGSFRIDRVANQATLTSSGSLNGEISF